MPASSSARRLLPMPGSPPTRISRPRPATALSSPSSSVPSSRWRPTKTAPACSRPSMRSLCCRGRSISTRRSGTPGERSASVPSDRTRRAVEPHASRVDTRTRSAQPGARGSRDTGQGGPPWPGSAGNSQQRSVTQARGRRRRHRRCRGGGGRHRRGARRELCRDPRPGSAAPARGPASPRAAASSSGPPSTPSRRRRPIRSSRLAAIEFRAAEHANGQVAAADPLLTQHAVDFREDERAASN